MSFEDYLNLGIFQCVIGTLFFWELVKYSFKIVLRFIDKLIDKAILKYSLNHENDIEDMK